MTRQDLTELEPQPQSSKSDLHQDLHFLLLLRKERGCFYTLRGWSVQLRLAYSKCIFGHIFLLYIRKSYTDSNLWCFAKDQMCECSLRYADIEKAEPSGKLVLLSCYCSFLCHHGSLPLHVFLPWWCRLPQDICPATGASRWTFSHHKYKINESHFFYKYPATNILV